MLQGSDWFSTEKNSILLQCLSVSAMDTSGNRTWPRRMAGLLLVVFLFVGVSAGTLEKLHEGESPSLSHSRSFPYSYSMYLKRIAREILSICIHYVIHSIFQKEPILSRLIIVSHNKRNAITRSLVCESEKYRAKSHYHSCRWRVPLHRVTDSVRLTMINFCLMYWTSPVRFITFTIAAIADRSLSMTSFHRPITLPPSMKFVKFFRRTLGKQLLRNEFEIFDMWFSRWIRGENVRDEKKSLSVAIIGEVYAFDLMDLINLDLEF